jgi:hypothetical protein
MAHSTPTIKTDVLRELIAAGSVRSALLIGQRGGFALRIHAGLQERMLATKYGAIKLFTRLDLAAKALRSLGLAEFAVDATRYEPGQLRPRRPDRVNALRHAYAVIEHDTWFRGEVQETLNKIERGEGEYVEHDALFHSLTARASARAGRA